MRQRKLRASLRGMAAMKLNLSGLNGHEKEAFKLILSTFRCASLATQYCPLGQSV